MHLDTFLTAAILVLMVTSIAVALFKHMGFGSVFGLLVAGIIVGPHSLGPYAAGQVEDMRHFTELGVVLLLFLIGLEMKPSRLWAMRRNVLGLGSLQILLSGAMLGIYFAFFQQSWQQALFIGFALALSSTAFVLQLLQEQGKIAGEKGSAAFSILLMQDLAVVPLLTIVPILSSVSPVDNTPLWQQTAMVAGMLIYIVVFGRWLLPKIFDYLARTKNKEGFILTVLLSVLLTAWLMHIVDASMALGAFVLGMLLSGSRYRLQIQAHIEPYKGILMSLFFVAVGMSIDIQALWSHLGLFVTHVAAVVSIKIIVVYLLALAFGYSRIIATKLSFLLAQGGEFGFVLFGTAKALHVIDDVTFVYVIGTISVTMLLTPLLLRVGQAMADSMEKRQPMHTKSADDLSRGQEIKVVVGGYGRVGHAVVTLLRSSGISLVAFDTDSTRVAQGRKDGLPVYYGDIADPHLLAGMQTDDISLVVITIDQVASTEIAVEHLRSAFPAVPIIARARDLESCSRLIKAGASHAYPEAVESSLRLGSVALEVLNVPSESVDMLMRGVRSNNYALVVENRPGSNPAGSKNESSPDESSSPVK